MPVSRTLLSLLVLGSVAGCSSWKLSAVAHPALDPLAPAPATAAKICVVRDSALAQLVTFPAHDNGVLVGATSGSSHFCYLAQPGEHRITIDADEVETAHLSAVAGQTYFLKEEVDNILGYVKCRSIWIAEPDGRTAVTETRSEILVGVPGSEALPESPPFAAARATRQ